MRDLTAWIQEGLSEEPSLAASPRAGRCRRPARLRARAGAPPRRRALQARRPVLGGLPRQRHDEGARGVASACDTLRAACWERQIGEVASHCRERPEWRHEIFSLECPRRDADLHPPDRGLHSVEGRTQFRGVQAGCSEECALVAYANKLARLRLHSCTSKVSQVRQHVPSAACELAN